MGDAVALKTSACDALGPITLENVRGGPSVPAFCLQNTIAALGEWQAVCMNVAVGCMRQDECRLRPLSGSFSWPS